MAKTLSGPGIFLGENLALRQEGVKVLRKFFIYFTIVLVFFSGIFFLAWQQIYIIKITYEIHQLRRSFKELSFANKKLKFGISSLSSLSRVEKEATGSLNLKTPAFDQVKIMEKKGK